MRPRAAAAILLSWLAGCGSDARPDPLPGTALSRPAGARATLVLTNATVHTLREDAAPATSIAVHEDLVLGVHGAAPEGDQVVDLGGAHVYPGLADAHAHFQGLGRALESVDLVGTRSYAEVIERVAGRAGQLPAGSWVVGRGWDQNDWPEGEREFPDHRPLSAAVARHPVWLVRVDGHAALANRMAMDLAGLVPGQADPDGGKIVRAADGQPSGVLVDKAMSLVGASIPDATAEEVRRRYLAAQDACLRAGLTSLHDAGVSPQEVEVLTRLEQQGELQLRVYCMLSGGHTDAIRKGPWQSPGGRVVVRAVKGYADGALGSRGAALLAPYADDPGNPGLMTTSPELLRRLARLCFDAGMQLCVHAIGDRGNREVLDAYAAVFGGPRPELRWRIEHAQVVAPEDFARFARLGVIPSMQPTHMTSDMPWAPARLGPERVKGAYAWRRFLDHKLHIAGGSDFPVEHHDPRKGLYAAVTTRPEQGEPAAGFLPDQRLTRREALLLFTAWAAEAAFEETRRGTIAPGRFADFTVFDRDLETCPEQELLEARVLMTVVGGKIAWRAPGR